MVNTAVYPGTDYYSQSRPARGRTRSRARRIPHQLQKTRKADLKCVSFQLLNKRLTKNVLRLETRDRIISLIFG